MSADERKAVYAELREALRPVAEYGAERGVKVAVEPLIRYETSVINTVEQALEAIDGLPPEGCGLLARHLPREHRGEGLRRRVHAGRRPRSRTCTPRPTTAARPAPTTSTGRRSATRCARAGYDGPVVIESFTAENETIATAASDLAPARGEQDAIAVDGLAFLRELLAS